MSCLLPVWKTCGAPTSVWMDSCGNSTIKRRASAVTKSWDDEATDDLLVHMVKETIARVKQDDPAKGDWSLQGDELNVWVDASSQAIGVLLEKNGVAIEDACWLRPPNDAAHINLAELDVVMKGINLALQWKVRKLCIHTDSQCVYPWILDILTGKARVRTKAASEMLIRWRLETIRKLVTEYNLSVDAVLVTSNSNLADRLTRVPQRWYDVMKKQAGPVPLLCAASVEAADKIREIHHNSGHPGVRRICYFVQLTNPSVSKSAVRAVVKECQTYQSIDPTPARWRMGWLGTDTTWSWLSMDITHYGSQHFLTLTDCGPTRFAIWRPLVRQDSSSVIRELESIFYERGPPEEILTDNDTAFCSMEFRRFVEEWGIRLRHRCAYVPSGNSIAERCYQSVKRIVARKVCTIVEAVCRYNATPKDAVTAASAPANAIHCYRVRIKGINARLPDRQGTRGPYKLGDTVWVKHPNSRCTTSFRRGRITGIVSEQAMLVDGTPYHVRDVQPALNTNPLASSDSGESSNDKLWIRPMPREPDGPTANPNTDADSSNATSESSDEEV